MVKKFFHKKSKRVSCSTRYKVEKKVRDHNKKQKRLAKKAPQKNKNKKDPGIPNSLPFKDEILQEAQRRKQRALELKMKQKDERHNLLMQKRGLVELQKDAEKRSEEFEEMQEADDSTLKSQNENCSHDYSTKTYYKEFRKVVEAADVILQVLDARDPIGSRCPQVEKAVLEAGADKRLVLVLNKIDLIPKENLEKWLKYLRNEFPTVAFKASTQSQRQNLSRNKISVLKTSKKMSTSNVCLGADMLIKLLVNYCRNKDIRTSISVGVVGFPNVGKSSLINSLKRSKACNVGATPGVTKSIQTVQLDKHIKLLDSPGIVMATGNGDNASIALKNAVKVETISDPIPAVHVIYKRASKDHLMLQYRLQNFSSFEEFLALLARQRGMLKKGGTPNIEKAARAIINDWNVGKIKYYTHPPEKYERTSHVSSKIVTEMSKEFDIEALLIDEKHTLKELIPVSNQDAMIIDSSGPTEGALDDGAIKEDAMTVDEPSITVCAVENKTEDKIADVKKSKNVDSTLKANAERKKDFKKMLKKRKKSDKLATSLADSLLSSMDFDNDSEDYDFATDYK